jgi:hypothetical protein
VNGTRSEWLCVTTKPCHSISFISQRPIVNESLTVACTRRTDKHNPKCNLLVHLPPTHQTSIAQIWNNCFWGVYLKLTSHQRPVETTRLYSSSSTVVGRCSLYFFKSLLNQSLRLIERLIGCSKDVSNNSSIVQTTLRPLLMEGPPVFRIVGDRSLTVPGETWFFQSRVFSICHWLKFWTNSSSYRTPYLRRPFLRAFFISVVK